jgi:beta-mannosidase
LRIILLHILGFLICVPGIAQNTEITLNTSWQFHKKGSKAWFPATVPGNVHTDLLTNKQIPDPFYSDNEKKVQWVENEDWEYKTTFYCNKKTLSQHNIELKFEGLDTYAKVYLNGKLILESDNMFRSWLVSVKKFIKEGENILSVIFESAVKKGKAEAAKLPYTLPGDEKVFTRKAQYQYGWDWGPRLVTCGIWKPIKLITWETLKIESIYAHTREIKDTAAKVDLIFEINCEEEGYYEVRYNLSTGAGKRREQYRMQTQLIALKPGVSTTTVNTTIPFPRIWWCNGMGKRKSPVYTAGIKITHGDTLITQQALQFGIRTLELVQDKDSLGSSFYFKLNDVPLFIKGANYIPQHNFLPSVGKDNERKLLMMVKNANMNMLRIWGGGDYPDEEFYKNCDRAGILVWQDFMFACAMYPGNKNFTENAKQEAVEQVKNLRNHPCLALWCGNNEIDEGWQNWGWQKQYNYSKKDSTKIRNDYKKLFHEILPAAVKQNDFNTPYWPSSPSIGWGHKESLQQGDSHYWGVWWGNEPFEMYDKKVGRFMSEYGFQGMSSIETFKSFCDSSDLNLNSVSVKNHQKHPTGYKVIKDYMERDYVVPKDFENFIYVSQLLQERGMKIAIEAHRRAKPYCMGTLFWQLNDCWPVTSWSAIDFYNRPKAFYYSLKNLYDDVLISIKKEGEDHEVFIINDQFHSIDGKLTVSVCDFSGKEIFAKKAEIKVIANTNTSYLSLSENEIKGLDKERMYLKCQFKSTDETVKKKSLSYFAPPKDLKLPIPKLEITYQPVIYGIKIKSNVLIKNIYLQNDDNQFSENYFDLEPGEEIEIRMTKPIKSVDEIKFTSINHINQ